MAITEMHFAAVLGHIRVAPEAQAVPAGLRQELTAMLEALEPEIDRIFAIGR